MAACKIAQLFFMLCILLIVIEGSVWKLKETRFDVQVKILRPPESHGFKKALRTKIRKFRRKVKFGGNLDFTTPYFLNASELFHVNTFMNFA